MTTKSHHYADKIIAEHPRAVYVLGDSFIEAFSRTPKYFDAYNTSKDAAQISSSISIEKVAPIVYGSDYSVFLSGNSETITLPSFGVFSSKAKYAKNTLEFWVKIDKPYLGKRKIVGPASAAANDNGLYVNQTSLILQIGTQSKTAYIKDFNRPFLVQIVSYDTTCSLIVNGELLLSLSLTDSDIALLPESDSIVFGPGTYDCISIYPYNVDRSQALRRFAFGQGVPSQENVIKSFDGNSVIVDYSKSNYASNYNYTTNSTWKQSKSNNLNVEQYALSNFQYIVPTFNSDTKTLEDLEGDISSTVFNLKSTSLASAVSNLKLDTLEMMNSSTKAFYIHGYYSALPSSEQILFKLVNNSNGSTFSISVNSNNIYYKIKIDTSAEYTVYQELAPATNLVLNSSVYKFIIGLDIDKFSAYCIENGLGSNVLNFFTNQEDLSVYIAGNDDLTVSKTSSANIYSVKFLTRENLERRSTLVLSAGTFNHPSNINSSPTGIEATQNAIVGSYDIRPYRDRLEYTDTGYRLTVATNGYWKNDIPLTHFCKTVKDVNGNDTYTFDFIQFNYDYESSILLDSTYLDTTNYETSVKSYVTFEPLNSAYQQDSVFTVIKANSDRVVLPTAGWETKKYEVADNFVIYPPTGIDLKEYTMVIHLDFDVLDTKNNVVTIQKMQLASQAYNANAENPIGTKFGSKMVPYTYTIPVSTRVYDYKAYNPFLINKKENPYIYMARDSGIRLVGFSTSTAGVYRGIKIPINESLKSFFNINVLQLSVFYNAELNTSSSPFYAKFPNSSEQIFEMQSNNKNIKFYLTRTGNGDTATLSAISDGVTNQDIKYYINGELKASPSIYTNKWYTLTIVFANPLIFDGAAGEFDLVGGISIDNLSYYQFTPEQIARNGWQLIVPYTWQYVSNTYTWEQLPNLSSISPVDSYSMFTGTNRLIGESRTKYSLALIETGYKYYSEVSKQTITSIPV